MYSSFNNIILNEFKDQMEGKNMENKNIIKLINSQYSNSLKNPFSNLMLRKTIIRHKIQTLNQIKKNLKQKVGNKKISYKQKNLYINFSDYYSQNQQKSKDNKDNNSNININNSIEESNFYKNVKNKEFSFNKKIFKCRNINPIKLLSASKTIHNLKYKYNKREDKEKTIVSINNKIVKINKMNITINNFPNALRFADKTMHTIKGFLPRIVENKNLNRLNKKVENIVNRKNKKIKTKSFRVPQISKYLKNTSNIFNENKKFDELINDNTDIYKSISADRNNNNNNNNNELNDYKYKKKKMKNIDNSVLLNDYHYRNKKRINIFTLLSLKNKEKEHKIPIN